MEKLVVRLIGVEAAWHNPRVIHDENPFAPADSDPLRRFRGRLAAPVTVITSGADHPTGLTVSSLFVIEGEPPLVYAVVGPNSDLYDVVQATGRFVVHICRDTQQGIAEVFAGLRPSPGGLFATASWEPSEWGPVLSDLHDRAYCALHSIEETGWSGILIGAVEHVEFTGLESPLIHFRGSYRRLDERG